MNAAPLAAQQVWKRVAPIRRLSLLRPFGAEQATAQSRRSLRCLYSLFGEFRFPLRLRGYYLARALAGRPQPTRIWDAGCGLGHTAFYLARRYPQADVFGSDRDALAVEHCRRIAGRVGLGHAHFSCGELTSATASAPKQCDLVVCFEVLEYIQEFQKAIEVLAGSLAPGGILLIHTPAAGRFQSNRYGFRRFSRRGIPRQDGRGQRPARPGFDMRALCEALTGCGLAVDRAEYTFGPLAMLAHTIYEVTRSRSKLWQFCSFPALMGLGWVDSRRMSGEGGGLLLVAAKR